MKWETGSDTDYCTRRGAGSSQVGSWRAEKMLYDDSNAALEEIRISDLEMALLLSQHLWRKHLRRDWLFLVICPRAETSTEKNDEIKRLERSATSGAYFSDL